MTQLEKHPDSTNTTAYTEIALAPVLGRDPSTLPTIKGWPIIGHLPYFIKNPLGLYERLSQLGPLARLNLPSMGKAYLVSDPALLEQILVARNREFGRPRFYNALRELLGNGLVLSEGAHWLKQRRMAQPAFHKNQIAEYASGMVAIADQTLSEFRAGPNAGPENMSAAAIRFSTKAVIRLLFGLDEGLDLEEGEIGASIAAVELVAPEIMTKVGSLVKLPEWLPTPGNRRFNKGRAELDRFIYHLIFQRRTELTDQALMSELEQPKPGQKSAQAGVTERKTDLLSQLIMARAEDGQGMSDQELRDEVLTLFFAGLETAAQTLSWVAYVLVKHLALQEQLASEINTILGTGEATRPPTLADLGELPLVEAFVKETLRFYPAGPLFGRAALGPIEVAGYRFEKGTTFLMSPWSMQHDSRYYPRPDEFLVERWLRSERGTPLSALDLSKFAYIPFGHGPHQCIGQHFAMLEITLFLVRLLQRFRLETPTFNYHIGCKAMGTLHSAEPVKVVLHPRHATARLSQSRKEVNEEEGEKESKLL